MKIKDNYSVVDIVGVSLIFVVLVILVLPLIIKTINGYRYDASKLKIQALISSALEEYKTDTSRGKTITAYCYRDDYGYAKTLNGGTIKSMNNLKDKVSYYITFDEEGYIISIAYTDNRYGVNISGYITESTINSLESKDFVKPDKVFEVITKCPYGSN